MQGGVRITLTFTPLGSTAPPAAARHVKCDRRSPAFAAYLRETREQWELVVDFIAMSAADVAPIVCELGAGHRATKVLISHGGWPRNFQLWANVEDSSRSFQSNRWASWICWKRPRQTTLSRCAHQVRYIVISSDSVYMAADPARRRRSPSGRLLEWGSAARSAVGRL
jgi:hypothetical protein